MLVQAVKEGEKATLTSPVEIKQYGLFGSTTQRFELSLEFIVSEVKDKTVILIVGDPQIAETK